MKDEKIVCLVAAAGRGKRFGREMPKTFHPVEGLTLLVRSLKNLSAWDGISHFVVMVPEGWEKQAEEDLAEASIISDFPLLFPVGGDHQPRQKFREGRFLIPISEEKKVAVYLSSLRRLDEKTDRYFHLDNEYMPLIRLEESTNYGVMTYELVSINGEPVTSAEMLR